jgi:hypothetical protein
MLLSACQLERADGDGILAERGEGHARGGLEDLHDMRGQGVFNGGPEGFSDTGQAAANDDDLRMKQVNDVREAECQVFGGFAQDTGGFGVALLQGRWQVSRLASLVLRGQAAQSAMRVGRLERANARVHGPTGAA